MQYVPTCLSMYLDLDLNINTWQATRAAKKSASLSDLPRLSSSTQRRLRPPLSLSTARPQLTVVTSRLTEKHRRFCVAVQVAAALKGSKVPPQPPAAK